MILVMTLLSNIVIGYVFLFSNSRYELFILFCYIRFRFLVNWSNCFILLFSKYVLFILFCYIRIRLGKEWHNMGNNPEIVISIFSFHLPISFSVCFLWPFNGLKDCCTTTNRVGDFKWMPITKIFYKQ